MQWNYTLIRMRQVANNLYWIVDSLIFFLLSIREGKSRWKIAIGYSWQAQAMILEEIFDKKLIAEPYSIGK